MGIRKLKRAAETLRMINAIVRFVGNVLATVMMLGGALTANYGVMLAGFLLGFLMSLSGIEAAVDRAAGAMEGWLANDDSEAE